MSSAASLLETNSSERGPVIGTREVENLPLNGREYADLAALVSGVRRNALENQTDSSRDASLNVNGLRSEFNNFLLDGIDNNAYGTSNQGFPIRLSRPPRTPSPSSALRQTTTSQSTDAPQVPSSTSASVAAPTTPTARPVAIFVTRSSTPSGRLPRRPTP